MTIASAITCDQCGKPIEAKPDMMVNNFLRLEPGTAPAPADMVFIQPQANVLNGILYFHDFDCLYNWMRINTSEDDLYNESHE